MELFALLAGLGTTSAGAAAAATGAGVIGGASLAPAVAGVGAGLGAGLLSSGLTSGAAAAATTLASQALTPDLELPEPPKLSAPTTMPDMGSDDVMDARAAAKRKRKGAKGRRSTILANDDYAPTYSHTSLGQ